jgi:hypothetical protein
MGFGKRDHLRWNIEAIEVAFKLEKEKRKATIGERLLLMQYRGFGGLKFVLNPVDDELDINHWRKNDHVFFPLVRELHQLLKDNSADDKEYRRYVDSMRSSVLTAFYTPPRLSTLFRKPCRKADYPLKNFWNPLPASDPLSNRLQMVAPLISRHTKKTFLQERY